MLSFNCVFPLPKSSKFHLKKYYVYGASLTHSLFIGPLELRIYFLSDYKNLEFQFEVLSMTDKKFDMSFFFKYLFALL